MVYARGPSMLPPTLPASLPVLCRVLFAVGFQSLTAATTQRAPLGRSDVGRTFSALHPAAKITQEVRSHGRFLRIPPSKVSAASGSWSDLSDSRNSNNAEAAALPTGTPFKTSGSLANLTDVHSQANKPTKDLKGFVFEATLFCSIDQIERREFASLWDWGEEPKAWACTACTETNKEKLCTSCKGMSIGELKTKWQQQSSWEAHRAWLENKQCTDDTLPMVIIWYDVSGEHAGDGTSEITGLRKGCYTDCWSSDFREVLRGGGEPDPDLDKVKHDLKVEAVSITMTKGLNAMRKDKRRCYKPIYRLCLQGAAKA